MIEAPINKTKKKSMKINFPIIFVILIILTTIGIFGYNTYLEGENDKLAEKISNTEKQIKDIEKDKNVRVFALKRDNDGTLKKLEYYSQISTIIDAVTDIEDNYNLILDGFNYSNGIVSTKATTDGEQISTPYLATSDFINKYRKNKKAKFMLPFISKVDGIDDMSFNLKLKINDKLIK